MTTQDDLMKEVLKGRYKNVRIIPVKMITHREHLKHMVVATIVGAFMGSAITIAVIHVIGGF